jgi:ABC-type multidrug transport system fused ATPase/permease subunit
MLSYVGLPFEILFINNRVAKFQEDTYIWFRKVADLCGGYMLVFVHNMGLEELITLEKESFQIFSQAFPIAGMQFSVKFFVVTLMNVGLPFLLVLQKWNVFDANVSVIFIIVRITEDLHNAWDEISNCMGPRGRYKIALQRIQDITRREFKIEMTMLDKENEVMLDAEEEMKQTFGVILLDNVKLGYIVHGRNQVVVQGSLLLHEGSVVGLVGESGSGKSTLLKSLYGILPPIEGEIMNDGRNIYDNLEQWLESISVIPQDCYLFNRTIRENICYGLKRNASDEEIETAATLAAAHDFIQQQPNGYDTVIQSGGVNLSGGQRQRIHLARAFLRSAKWIIMDEPTSALDSRIQHSFIENLKGFLKDGQIAGCIISTHRQELLELCDEVYTVEEGNIKKLQGME